jgi:hypothetical protein
MVVKSRYVWWVNLRFGLASVKIKKNKKLDLSYSKSDLIKTQLSTR